MPEPSKFPGHDALRLAIARALVSPHFRGRERISGGAGSIYAPREREPYDVLSDRFLHDYLPDELAALYAAIIEDAVPEFRRLEAASAERLR
jgi:hypothetical protein